MLCVLHHAHSYPSACLGTRTHSFRWNKRERERERERENLSWIIHQMNPCDPGVSFRQQAREWSWAKESCILFENCVFLFCFVFVLFCFCNCGLEALFENCSNGGTMRGFRRWWGWLWRWDSGDYFIVVGWCATISIPKKKAILNAVCEDVTSWGWETKHVLSDVVRSLFATIYLSSQIIE